jgi:anti-sigma regulatory factor (Ser/Thr protein kinase)
MADDIFWGKPAGPDEVAGQAGRFDPPGGMRPVLDVAFDYAVLDVLRTEVMAHACQAGLSDDRAGDVVLAIHELASNAIRHGAGAGRLRVWNPPGVLRCQVDDGTAADEAEVASGQPARTSLPCLPGHGLWVVRKLADQMQVWSGPRGTRVITTFGAHRSHGP